MTQLAYLTERRVVGVGVVAAGGLLLAGEGRLGHGRQGRVVDARLAAAGNRVLQAVLLLTPAAAPQAATVYNGTARTAAVSGETATVAAVSTITTISAVSTIIVTVSSISALRLASLGPSLAKRCRLGMDVELRTVDAGRIHIGEDIRLNRGCTLTSYAQIRIGGRQCTNRGPDRTVLKDGCARQREFG